MSKSRSVLAFNSALDELTRQLDEHDSKKVIALFDRMALDEELLAVGFCDQHGALLYKTKQMPKAFNCKEATLRKTPTFSTVRLDRLRLLVSSFPVAASGEQGHLVLVHDLALVKQRGAQAWLWTIVVLVGVVFLAAAFAALVTVLLARRWLQSLRRAIDNVRLGGSGALEPSEAPLFAREFRHLLRDLQLTDISADGPDVDWSPAMLRNVLTHKLPGAEVIVVSNREPYIHNREGNDIVLQTPASGLVAAIEPDHARLRRHLDRARQRKRRPGDRRSLRPYPCAADSPSYTSCAASGRPTRSRTATITGSPTRVCGRCVIWRSCGPNFREGDWNQYKPSTPGTPRRSSTEAKHPDPIILVQDYHFALLPRHAAQEAAECDHHHVLAHPLA